MSSATGDNEPAVHLAEIGQIALHVRDVPRAKAFYRDILGMRFLFDAGSLTFFQCGSIRLMIGASEKDVSNEGTILYFRVPDIHRAWSALRSRGVSFIQEPHLIAKMPDHDLWMAFLHDPDGNTLALMSEVAANPTEQKR